LGLGELEKLRKKHKKLMRGYIMENKWNRLYERRFLLRDYLGNLFSHALLLEEIIKENPKKILEVGIGTGSMSIF
jgi:GR25 family glycosyltransferase involved in LPS biosynthesis